MLDRAAIDVAPATYLRAVGDVFAVFDRQDSGNVSYGVVCKDRRWFVKTAGDPTDARPVLDHATRVALLRNAARLARTCDHPTLVRLHSIVESPEGPLLVYDWCDGELVGVPRERRDDPASSFQRFCRMPLPVLCRAFDSILELHAELARSGWIASDFYDGCLLYDFTTGALHVIDLDNYRDAPFTNEMGRMFGSTRFMAPEERERGARIDHATTVFTLGRAGQVFLGERATPSQAAVLARACATERADRFASPSELLEAWRAA